MNSPITLHLDRSDPTALFFEQDGRRVDLEAAFRDGFRVDPNDAPAILTLAVQFLESRDAYQK